MKREKRCQERGVGGFIKVTEALVPRLASRGAVQGSLTVKEGTRAILLLPAALMSVLG